MKSLVQQIDWLLSLLLVTDDVVKVEIWDVVDKGYFITFFWFFLYLFFFLSIFDFKFLSIYLAKKSKTQELKLENEGKTITVGLDAENVIIFILFYFILFYFILS